MWVPIKLLGTSILEKTFESNRSANQVRKKKSLLRRCRLEFKLYSSLLASGCVQFKNGVDLVEESLFYKSETTERSNRSAER